MDDRGYWHKTDLSEQFKDELNGDGESVRPRYVIACDIGEAVRIVLADGQSSAYTFDDAEKNKVTFTPLPDQTHPYLDFGSTVTVEKSTGEKIKAQVWDNRKGKVILRTLPIGHA